jgi:dolichol-phosphate mannosyltransferase
MDPLLTVVALAKDEPSPLHIFLPIQRIFNSMALFEVEYYLTTLEGPAYALARGVKAAGGKYVVITMGDGSDDPITIPIMTEKAEREGLDIVCSSRNIMGGKRIGAPFIKSWLSKIASLSLYWLTSVGTSDATNAFKLYRKSAFPEHLTSQGFEVSLEILYYAMKKGLKVGEVPTIWTERRAGKSKFHIFKWLPGYLKWYIKILLRGFYGRA